MSDVDKLLTALDAVESKVADYEKSSSAALAAAQDGVKAVETEMAGIRKQVQEIAELTKQGIPREKRDVCASLGKMIVDQVRGVNKAASEGTDADGGYLVNDELMTEIKSVQNEYGLVRKIFGNQIVPMASDVTKMPVDTFEDAADANAPIPTATSENAIINESNVAQLSQLTLTAQKYATLSYISNELISDSFVDYLGAYLTPKLARKAAKIEDNVVFTAATTGMLNSSSVTAVVMEAGKTSFQDIKAEYIFDLEDAACTAGLQNGRFLMHRTIRNLLRKQKGTDGQFILSPANGAAPSELIGYPYDVGEIFPAKAANAISTGFVLFGDPTLAAVVGERTQRSIVASKEFRFNYDQTAIRMTFRFAYSTNANIGRACSRLVTAAA
jgi:HK97 family phage major capsid protein